MSLPVTPVVQSLPATVPFVGPETQERARGARFRARLGANENSFGPSPSAVAAMTAAAGEIWKYGDPENHDLRQALAAHHGVGANNIVIGEGIDALLGLAVRLIVSPGTPVVTSLGAYPTFNFHVQGFGGVLTRVPYRGDHEDWQGLLAAAAEQQAPLLYFANPDNPMGTWWPADDVAVLIDRLPAGTVLCLDEAYGEFAPPGTLPPIDVSKPGVLRFRTFSKAHGMAGARIGYCIGHAELIGQFEKIRNHFGVSRLAQAGALASLADVEHLAHIVHLVDDARRRITAIATENGLTALPSATNFVTIDCGRDGDFARRLLAELVQRDVFVRMPGIAPLDRCIRISCGLPADLDVFAAELPKALAAVRSM